MTELGIACCTYVGAHNLLDTFIKKFNNDKDNISKKYGVQEDNKRKKDDCDSEHEHNTQKKRKKV